MTNLTLSKDRKAMSASSLFPSYLLVKKEITATKNRIHSLLKQGLLPFTKEYIFGGSSFSTQTLASSDHAAARSLQLYIAGLYEPRLSANCLMGGEIISSFTNRNFKALKI